MVGIFVDFLEAGASALEVSCADKSAVAQHSLPNRHSGLEIRLVFQCEFGLFIGH